MPRPGVLALAGTIVIVGIGTPLAAYADTSAPPGDASAVAAQVVAGGTQVVSVAQTTAHAGQDGANATANALALGGSPPASQFGGTQKGAGESSGSFLDTGPSSSGRLQVTPWDAKVSDDGSHRHSHSQAALARLALGDPTTAQSLTVDALQSSSDADWTSAASRGSSSSDGLLVNAGDGMLVIDVLHAEATSNGQGSGSSYLVSVNGNQIGTSQQANGGCALTVPSLLTLSCLTASGGNGSAVSQVLQTALGDTTTPQSAAGTIVGAGASGSSAATVAPPAAAQAPAPAAAPATPTAAPQLPDVARGAAPAGSLPLTGANLWFDLVTGLALVALGGTVVTAERRLGLIRA